MNFEALTFDPNGEPEVTINLALVGKAQDLRDVVELAVTTLSLPKRFAHDTIRINVRNVEWWAKNVHGTSADPVKSVRAIVEEVARDAANVAADFHEAKRPELTYSFWN